MTDRNQTPSQTGVSPPSNATPRVISPLTQRPIKFLGVLHKNLIKDDLMPVPKGYLLLVNKRIFKGRSSDLSKYYVKKYGHFFVTKRRLIHPLAHEFGAEIEDIIRTPTKIPRAIRKEQNTYAVRVEGEYIIEGVHKGTKEGNFMRCIRVKGYDNIDTEVRKIIKELEERYTNSSKIIQVSNVKTRIVNLGKCEYTDDFYMSVPMWGRSGKRVAPRMLGFDMIDYDIDTGKGMCCIDALWGRYGDIIPNLTREKILDCFRKFDFDREVGMNTGHTIQMVQHFCEKYHIKHWALDMDGNLIHRWLSKSKKYPVLVYIYGNNHMYLIQDKAIIKSITNSHKELKICSNAMVQRGLKQMEEKNEELKDYAYEIDTPWNEVAQASCSATPRIKPETNIFYTTETLEPLIQYLFNKKGIMPITATVRDGCITKLKLKDDVFIYANPCVREVMDACEGLEIDFTNQTLESLVFELYKKTNPNHTKSSYNPETFDIFREEKTTVFRDDWGVPDASGRLGKAEGGVIQGVDMRSCYPNILKRKDIIFPLYCPLDEVEIYAGETLQVGFYFIETTNYMPAKGSGWYREFMVEELRRLGETVKITHKLIPSRTYAPGYFTEFISALQKGGKIGKDMARKFSGILGKKDKRKESVKFSSSFNEMLVQCVKHENTNFRPICKGLYRLDICDEIDLLEDNLPVYLSMINMAMLELNRLRLKVGGRLLKTKTDCVIVENPVWLPDECDLKYRMETVKDTEMYSAGKVFIKDAVYIKQKREWADLDLNDDLIDLKKGFMVNGKPGTGKSWTLNNIRERLDEEKIKYLVCAPTHSAAHKVNGETFHSIFGMSVDTGKICEKAMNKVKGYEYLFIDECSMLTEEMINVLVILKKVKPKIKIGMFGDYAQLPPVENTDDATLKIKDKINQLVAGCKAYDKEKGYYNDLDETYVYTLLKECNNRSVVSGGEFDWFCDDKMTKPSLDRLDNGLGHCKGNLRFITEYENWIRNTKDFVRCNLNKFDRDYKNSLVLKHLCDCNRLELTEYKRATDMNDILDGDYSRGFGKDTEVNIHLVYTNKKRKELNAECMERWVKDGGEFLEIPLLEEDKNGRGGQDVKLMIGMPVYAITTDKKIGIYNSETFTVSAVGEGLVVLTNNKKELEISASKFQKSFVVGFAKTSHKAQGETIREPYCIWEWKMMSPNMKYVAVSRASGYELINVA